MAAKFGGWTRIWLVCAAISAALAVWAYGRVADTAAAQAQAEYQSATELRKACDTPEQPGSDGDIAKRFMKDACSGALSAEQIDLRRSDRMRQAQGQAVRFALGVFLWPTITIGVVFLAIGWVRAGFRKK
jgi:hypothetical protein